MNKINDYGNMKVTVKLDDGRNDVKYDGAYLVTPTKEITVNSKVCLCSVCQDKRKNRVSS